MIALCCELEEPTSYAEAMSGILTEEWKTAVKKELDALAENNTWGGVRNSNQSKGEQGQMGFQD